MSDRAAWPVDLIPAEEGGFIVNFPDLPNGWSQGETRDEALTQAEDLLDEIILGRMAHNEDVPRPSPSKGRPVVALLALTAAKFEAYRAMRAAGLNKSQLAERLGWETPPVKRPFCGRPPPRLASRPDRGGPPRARAAPGGHERIRVSTEEALDVHDRGLCRAHHLLQHASPLPIPRLAS